ncbi:phage tail tube protein [Chitinibacter sp. GC72]|uniref:phage tail tube protein n=1 Tax=Chitinibacter sp. GC72 TaxID=1526917 RepID=UPI0012FC37DC|nr:phage tail tube protein [Chitinibacter sp. GC72]
MPAVAKKYRNVLVTAKPEAIYGTDAAPEATTNGVLLRSMTLNPLEQEMESMDYLRPYFGNGEEISVAESCSAEIEVALAGSGAAGTAPAWGALVRACGISESITPGSKVEYRPITNFMESLTLYAYLDGHVHKIVGSRSDLQLSFTAKKVPVMKFKLMGLFAPVIDLATPAGAVFTSWKKPVPFSTAFTPDISLFGVSDLAVESFEFNLGNDLQHRVLVGADGVEIADRKPSGSSAFRMPPIAAKNWFDVARNSDTGAVRIIHGTVPGNIIQFDAPAAQIKNPSYKNSEGDLMLDAKMTFLPVAGNDEFVITVK